MTVYTHRDVNVLAIETSCDETACSIVRNGREVLSNAIFTQMHIHREYGGVVPEIASRNHLEKINDVVDKAILDAGLHKEDIDVIAVTSTPGLIGALVVGVATAKTMAYALSRTYRCKLFRSQRIGTAVYFACVLRRTYVCDRC